MNDELQSRITPSGVNMLVALGKTEGQLAVVKSIFKLFFTFNFYLLVFSFKYLDEK